MIAASDDPARLDSDDGAKEAAFTRPMRFVWRYVKARRGPFSVLLVSVVLAATAAVAIQYQMKVLVDAMTDPVRGMHPIWLAFTAFILLIGVESLLWRLSAWLTCRNIIAVGVAIRLDLFERLGRRPLGYFVDNYAGSLGQRITGTAGSFGALANTVVWRIVPPIIDFAGALVIFAFVNWRMTAALGVYVATATSVLVWIGERGRHLHAAYFRSATSAAGSIVDVVSNIWAVKAFSAHDREWVRLKNELDEEAGAQRHSWMYNERTRLFYDLVLWAMAAGMLFWALRSWSLRSISAGGVVVVSALTFRILHGSRDVALALADARLQVAFIEDTLSAIGDARPHRVCAAMSSNREAPAAGARGTVSEERRAGGASVGFRNVDFSYDPGRLVLRNVNLVIRSGEKIGIVGPSGAGKTTLFQLIQRLHDVRAGSIEVAGYALAELSEEALRACIAVVPQETILFHRSVRENIRFGRPDASDADVRAAAQAAQCEEFIRALPQGFSTLVGERGVRLSGGERQRIGLARAFLKQAPILLLDEATSALDRTAEVEIQRSIVRLLGNRTVLAITHRLSTLQAFDRILLVKDGRVTEEQSLSKVRRLARGSEIR